MTLLLILFAVLSACDAWTTYTGLKLGAKEAWIPKFAITGVLTSINYTRRFYHGRNA